MKNIFKKIFSKHTLNVFLVIYALFSIVAVLIFADMQLCSNLKNIQVLDLNGSWNVVINDTSYENVSLDSFRFKPLQKGSTITLETTLPDDWDYIQPALSIHICHSILEMYIDDECVYTYGYERYEAGKTVGSGIELINFSNDYKGKQLKLKFTATENNSFSKLGKIYISEWNDSFRYILSENRLALFLGAFLVVFGITVSIITSFAIFYSKKYTNILWLAAFSIFMGFWSLCYHNIIVIFSMPLYAKSLLEYMCLLIIPIPILGYMYSYVRKSKQKKVLPAYITLFVTQIIVSASIIILHTTDTVHCAALLPIPLILFVVDAIFFTYILVKPEYEFSKNKVIYIIAYAVILSSLLYDLAIYVLKRYVGLNFKGISGVSSLGILIFIAILILDLYHELTTKMMAEHERNLLIKRAYTDELTQINNRYFCSEYMEHLQNDNISNYSIIAFDLNNLKITNDTFGHIQGDILITAAAEVISEAFSSSGIVGRMGGDEFIAVLTTSNMEKIHRLTEKFTHLIADKNSANPDLNLSISYGIATCNEINDNQIEKVYQLADERMYKYKANYKNSHK